jgi:ArsR family transcriptional regulator, arsenate/arsenite/antimonite-responsive transcriptional repressor
MISKTNDLANQSTSNGRAPDVSDSTVKDLVKVFKLLSDETRLRILLYLMRQKELHVRALCELLGQSQPAVSHHLALLRVAELIEPRREGKHNFYRILPARFEQVLDTLFAAVPKQDRSIRFEDYVLSYAPGEDLL